MSEWKCPHCPWLHTRYASGKFNTSDQDRVIDHFAEWHRYQLYELINKHKELKP